MKPLAVLVPGIDKKIITGATIIDDTKTSFRNDTDENYSPKNNEGYLGKETVRRALESSQNIPFVKMLENILLVISILLIAIVLLQGNKASDAGGIITGGNDNLFQHQKERGLELVVSRITMILGILFFVISLILFLK